VQQQAERRGRQLVERQEGVAGRAGEERAGLSGGEAPIDQTAGGPRGTPNQASAAGCRGTRTGRKS
jgi:hypothetical protein